jgi:chromosome partitioning protein
MGPIIALCGQKGGTGKSTTAIAIAGELHHRRGMRVLLVVGDPQGTTSTWAQKAAEANRSTPMVVAMNARMHLPGQLDNIGRDYDAIVIDCPGRLDAVQRSALQIADIAVLPCGPTGPEAWALTQSVELVQEAMEVRPEMKAFVLVTRKIVGAKIGADAQSTFSEWGLPVLGAELCMRVAYQEAITGGDLVTSYAEGQPAGDEVSALVNELWRDDAKGKARRERNRQAETPRINTTKRSRAR